MAEGSFGNYTGRGRRDDDDAPADLRNQGNKIVDKRKPDRISIPHYIVREFGAQLKPYALAVYLGLCYHVSRERIVHPSYGRIGQEIGCSRSTVERAMRLLKEVGLVIVVPRFDGNRQTSNLIYLVDPGTKLEDVHPAPPVSPTAPADSQGEGVYKPAHAPANSRRGGRPLDGAEVVPEEVEPEGEGAPPPSAAPPNGKDARPLVDLWMSLVVCHAKRLRAEHRNEIEGVMIELLRRGYTPEHLETAILARDRDRTEWPRLFLARVGRTKPPKQPRQGAPTVQTGQEATEQQNAAEAMQRLRTTGGMAELMRRKASGQDVRGLLTAGIGQPAEE